MVNQLHRLRIIHQHDHAPLDFSLLIPRQDGLHEDDEDEGDGQQAQREQRTTRGAIDAVFFPLEQSDDTFHRERADDGVGPE